MKRTNKILCNKKDERHFKKLLKKAYSQGREDEYQEMLRNTKKLMERFGI